jgi:hypothetical protein
MVRRGHIRQAIRARHAIAATLLALAPLACGTHVRGTEPSSADSAVKSGQWAGQHIVMTVAAERTEIEFDCGKATVGGAIVTDTDGAFRATGTFLQERPGPTTPGGPPRRPMRLSGAVKDDNMQVTVVLTDRDEDVGTFTLTFGAAPRLVKCR